METVTMSSKGQITIPSQLRKKLGLEGGAQLRLFSTEDGKGFEVTKSGSIMDFAGSLPKPKRALSIDEINEAIARGAVEDGASF